ncbi:unnamed protein product [Rotaria sp. Silwood2]|nr:unnamed protein product [Rotaria sp. Silwood2]CAF2755320.1 unnamed protein product [Rotaria sp. Silwood2]CAF3285164.1 unnamed protein product [Rotaria sp. Silwood2]CAF3381673.1 unnamed protein product [Rotaria sp. Silwood2]CAF3887259.1 unnamed protein product [Rotaria sp. Silwood2]
MNYEKIISKLLLPEFSIVLRCVPVDIEINSLLTNIKTDYPDVLGAFRITGMNKRLPTLVRLDIQNISVIDKLLDKKFNYYENLRLVLTKYLLSTAAAPVHQQNVRADFHLNDLDFPVVNGNLSNIPYRTNNSFINTGKKINEMFIKMKYLDDNMNRLIDLNNK